MVRLYVGGLPPNVAQPELEARFAAFGSVSSCQYAAPKPQNATSHRGFAYVELTPKDDGAVAKCLSVYNHSKWKGHELRVELARPDFLARLHREWEEEEEDAERSDEPACTSCDVEFGQQEAPSNKPLYFPIPGRKRKFVKAPLDGSLPDGKKRVKKTYFPPAAPCPLGKLLWSVPASVSDNSAIQKLNELELQPGRPYVPASPPLHAGGVAVPLPYQGPAPAKAVVLRPRETHGYLKILKAIDSQVQRQALKQPSAAAALPQPTTPRVVEFLEDGQEDAGGAARSAATAADDLRRFDDSGSEDEHDKSEGPQERGSSGRPPGLLPKGARYGVAGGGGAEEEEEGEEEAGAGSLQSEGEELEGGEDVSEGDDVAAGSAEEGDDEGAASDLGLSDPDGDPGGEGDGGDDRLAGSQSRKEGSESQDAEQLQGPEPRARSLAAPPSGHVLRPAAARQLLSGVHSGRAGQLDLSRFGSDSDEVFRDMDSDEAAAPPEVLDTGGRHGGHRSEVDVRLPAKPELRRQERAVGSSLWPGHKEATQPSRKQAATAPSSEGQQRPTGQGKQGRSPELQPAANSQVPSPAAAGPDPGGRRPAAFVFNFPGAGRPSKLPDGAAAPTRADGLTAEGVPASNPAASIAALLQGFGRGFVCPRDRSDEEVRAAWDAQREALVADYKSKQRTALRNAGQGGRGGARRQGGRGGRRAG